MPSYVLYYFPARGAAETTRLIFKAAGVDFEDRRLTGEEWASFKATGEAPFDQLPILQVDGKVIAQSRTISRFVANEVGLAPSSNLQKAQADMIVDGCVDFRSKFRGPLLEKDETKKAKLLDDLKDFVPKQLEMFENLLKANNGGKCYFVGDKLSYADLMFFNMMNSAFADGKFEITDERVKAHPLLLKHYNMVLNIPAITKWLQERPQTAN